MNTINFHGIKGQVLQSSPHGNYLVVALSDRVSICGTFSNQFHWEESDADPFKAFVTYVGCRNEFDAQQYLSWADKNGGWFDYAKDEDQPRSSKRIRDRSQFPLEIKVRGLTAQSVVQLAKR